MTRHSQSHRRAPCCRDPEPAKGRRYPLLCTEPVGHDGDHVARNELGTVLAAWPRHQPRRRP